MVQKLFFLLLLPIFFTACTGPEKKDILPNTSEKKAKKNETTPRNLSSEFKDYWFSGTAELTSYQLTQERYGELRKGTAISIFVSEDFLPEAQVKADRPGDENITVLKRNATKNFITGIYPYSIMTSSFTPVATRGHARKVSLSVQEWCGQAYVQLNNRDTYEIVSHSYFEGEADREFTLEKAWLEDELWSLIRLEPGELPTGEITVIPSFEFSRLRHKDIAIQEAFAGLKQGDSLSIYTLNYPQLQRQLTIYFNSTFPYEIEKWEETNAGVSADTTRLKTTAVRMKRMRTAYWRQNSIKDTIYRDSLGLN